MDEFSLRRNSRPTKTGAGRPPRPMSRLRFPCAKLGRYHERAGPMDRARKPPAAALGVGAQMGRRRRHRPRPGLRSGPANLHIRPVAAPGLNNNAPATTATAAARTETLRLLAEFSRLQQEQRATDLAALKLSLQDVDVRLAGLRSELETVAVNTQTGFQETHQNLTHLVSLSLPPNNEPSSLIPK